MIPISPGPPSSKRVMPTRVRLSLLAGCAVLVLSLFVGAIWLGNQTKSADDGGASGRVDATEVPEAAAPTSAVGSSTTDQHESGEGPETGSPNPTTSTSPEQASGIGAPPLRPADDGASAEVWEHSEGKPCRTSISDTIWGGYPVATCRFWQKARGMTTGEHINKGTRRIACQRNLGIDNPIYTKNQTNTWWVWTRSVENNWDWFPETAIAEGASGQAINGIAICI